MTGGILFLLNYLQGRSDETVVTSNVNTNTTGNNAPPANTSQAGPTQTDRIRIEFTAKDEAISLNSTIDGATNTETVAANTPKVLEGSDSVKLSYYKGFADKVELKLNGKTIEPPPAPVKGQVIIRDRQDQPCSGLGFWKAC